MKNHDNRTGPNRSSSAASSATMRRPKHIFLSYKLVLGRTVHITIRSSLPILYFTSVSVSSSEDDEDEDEEEKGRNESYEFFFFY